MHLTVVISLRKALNEVIDVQIKYLKLEAVLLIHVVCHS